MRILPLFATSKWKKGWQICGRDKCSLSELWGCLAWYETRSLDIHSRCLHDLMGVGRTVASGGLAFQVISSVTTNVGKP
jgi:hypothetical protein